MIAETSGSVEVQLVERLQGTEVGHLGDILQSENNYHIIAQRQH